MINLLQDSVIQAAKRRGDACAFRCGKQQITYAELDEASNRLASLLIEQGVLIGDRIGVFMPRCVETAIAIYGVLKAGAVFVPLDPNLPAGGIGQLVNDCEIKVILTQPKKRAVLEEFARNPSSVECIIGLPSDVNLPVAVVPWEAIDAAGVEPVVARELKASDPAYIMYSSGSTGRPKGITHTHASGLAYARLSVQTYDVVESDVIANHSPINFDMSTFGYFSSCYAGATTVLIPEAYTKVPASLLKLISDTRITIWYSVPRALIQLLLRSPLENFDLSHIRWVMFGGESFQPKHLKALMKQWPHAKFSNVYGPAEVNQCTYYHVPKQYSEATELLPIPIGRVWDQTDGLIIDGTDAPITNGEPGELVISSPTMMTGYWARPDRNSVAFYRPNESQVFYRTGDLVQRREDGELMFLGRIDRQIKIRGYRVELDDIEHALTGHVGIEEAGVFCVEVDGEKQILASTTLKPGGDASEEELKSFLGKILSPYSVPSKIEIVEHLPRTTSGKIDRKQLKELAEGSCNTR